MDQQERFERQGGLRLARGRRRLLLAGTVATVLVAGGLAVPALAQASASRATVRQCSFDQLRVSLDRSGSLPGANRYGLRYTNIGKSRCTLTGFPTLQFRDAKGHSLGRAVRDPRAGKPATVTLAPRGSAFSMFAVMVLAPSSCHPAQAARILVHPPVRGSATATRTVTFRGTVCTARGTEAATSAITARPAAVSASVPAVGAGAGAAVGAGMGVGTAAPGA